MSSFMNDTPYNGNHRGGSLLPPRHTYSFPLLKTDEIVKCLNELGLQVTQEELQHPDQHRETARRLLEELAEICLGISREESLQPVFQGIHTLAYPELHDDSVPNINLFRLCCRMMDMCEIPDFSLKDVMSPTATRLRRQLSGIINFAKFREERLLLLSQLSTTREGLISNLNQLKDRNETLNNRLSLLREQTADEAAAIATLEGECKTIETDINDLNQQQIDIKHETEELSKNCAEMKEEIAIKSQIFEELTDERRNLSSQLVSSPEKFRAQIIEVGQNLQAEQKDGKAAEKKLRELAAWLVNVEEAQGELNCALEAMYDLRAEVERQKSVMADLDTQKLASTAERVALSEVEQNMKQLQRQCNRAEEKVQQLRKQSQLRGEETQQAIEDLHKQLIDAEAFRVQVSACVEREEGEVALLEKEMNADAESHEQEIADITQSYQRLEKVVISHLRNLQSVLQRNITASRGNEFSPTGRNKENLLDGNRSNGSTKTLSSEKLRTTSARKENSTPRNPEYLL